MYRDLLVHVDGSSADGKGCSLPSPLARRMGARLSGIHVTPPPGRPLKFKPSHIIREASEIPGTWLQMLVWREALHGRGQTTLEGRMLRRGGGRHG